MFSIGFLSADQDTLQYLFFRWGALLVQLGITVALAGLLTALAIASLRFARGFHAPRLSERIEPLSQRTPIFSATIFSALLIAQVYWMKSNDLWTTEALFREDIGPAYVAMRVLHLFLMWVVISSLGFWLLRFFKPLIAWPKLSTVELTVVVFLVGSSVLRIAMFALGYVGLYRVPVLLPIALACIWIGRRDLLTHSIGVISELAASTRSISIARLVATGAIVFACVVSVFFLFLHNALYISNENGDYVTHYGPFYDLVLKSGGIWPNDVWYQYFYSKGEGVAFFSMALSDKLSKQLTAILFLLVGALVLFRMASEAMSSRLWGAVTALLSIALFVHNDSGAFEKHHAVVAMHLLALTYFLILLWRSAPRERRFWSLVGGITCISLALLSPPACLYLFVTVALMTLAAWVFKKRFLVVPQMIWIASATVTIAIVLVVNFATTGLPEITPFNTWLRFLDISKFSEWVSPHLITYLEQGSSGFNGSKLQGVELLYRTLAEIFVLLRMDRVGRAIFSDLSVFTAVAVLVTAVCAYSRKWRLSHISIVYWIAGAILIAAVLGYFAVSQTVSIHRASAFTLFFSLLLLMALPRMLLRTAGLKPLRPLLTTLFGAWIVVHSILLAIGVDARKLEARLNFLSGRTSMADSFQQEYGVPSELFKLRQQIDDDQQILYLRASNDAGLAHFLRSGIQSEISYSLSPQWHILAFGRADEAAQEFKRLRTELFLINLDEPLFGAIPMSELFLPVNIRKYFVVRWQSGPLMLLKLRPKAANTELEAAERSEECASLPNSQAATNSAREEGLVRAAECDGDEVSCRASPERYAKRDCVTRMDLFLEKWGELQRSNAFEDLFLRVRYLFEVNRGVQPQHQFYWPRLPVVQGWQ